MYTEKDYLMHYGRKGMKWYQHIFGSDTIKSSRKIKNAVRLKDYKGPLYFISEQKMDGSVLKPRVPSNYFTKNGFEDSETARVSFAPSINQCLMGLSQNNTGKVFYVYEPKNKKSLSVYKPNKKAVPDSDLTGELWVTSDVELKRVKKIVCTGDLGLPGKKFNYGNSSAELYDWDYMEIN